MKSVSRSNSDIAYNAILQIQTRFWRQVEPKITQSKQRKDARNISEKHDEYCWSIYRTNVLACHMRAMEQTFSKLKQYLTAPLFNILVKQFCQHIPVNTADLNEIGLLFPAFIEKIKERNPILSTYPYLIPLAKWDLAISKAFYAEDELQPNESMIIELINKNSNSVKLANHISILTAPCDLLAPEYLSSPNGVASSDQTVFYFLIYRSENQVKTLAIDHELHQTLLNIQTNGSLACTLHPVEAETIWRNLTRLGFIAIHQSQERFSDV